MDVCGDFCLICNTSSKDATVLHTLLPVDHCPKAGNKDGSDANLDEHLSVILLLRKVLCVRQSFLASVLESSGKDPSSWDIKLCQMCHRIFGEASFVWGRLKKLHEEFEQLSEMLRSKLVRNVEKKNPPEKEQNEISGNDKRRRGRPGRRRSIKSKVRISYTPDEPEVSQKGIVEAIRQEFLKRHDEVLGYKRVRFQEDVEFEGGKKSSSFNEETSVTKQRCTQLQDSHDLKDVKPRIQLLLQGEEGFKNIGGTEQNNTEISDHENFNMDDPNDSFDDMDVGAPENEPKDGNDDTADKGSDEDFDLEDCRSEEEDVDSLAEDSDVELNNSKSSNSPRKRRCRKNPFVNGERGVIHRAIKSKSGDSYECSKCQKKGFQTSSACDEHILSIHYGGIWPQNFTCNVCEDRSFKGENWLRYHMKMRHPGVKLPSDELVERCIKEGTITQLTYEVVPYGPTSTKPTQDMESETVHPDIKTEPVEPDAEDLVTLDDFINDEDSAQTCRIPVRMTNGNMRYIVVPAEFFSLPEDVVAKFKEGAEEKVCEICDNKKFPTEVQYDAHVRRAHEGEKYSYRCPCCPKSFERIGHMVLQHMLTTHVPGRFHCDRCGNMFKEEILLNAHVQRVHLGIQHPFQCLKCGIRHPRRASLNKHLKRVHKLQLKCYIPERKGGRVKNSGKPVKKKKPKLPLRYPCEECTREFQRDVKFATVEELDVHEKRQHLGISRPYPCTVCKHKYSRPWLLDEHMQTHTVRSDLEVDAEVPIDASARYVCGPCNKEFKTKSQLDSHNQGRNHKNVRPYVCELCSQGFRGLRYLQHHQEQKHHKELNLQPSKCKYCSKVLSSPRTLEDHIRIKHTKNAKFKCPHCDTYFQFETNMERHINCRHTKSTKFLCVHCPKWFTHAQYLQNHIRVHTGEKPYACRVCDKRFADKSTYNRHVEAHNDTVHQCSECKKTGFKTRHALGVHMKTHRGIKRNPRSRAQANARDNDTNNTHQYFVPPEENTASNDNSTSIEDKYESDQAPQLTVPEQEMAHSSARLDTMPTLYPSFKVGDTLPFL